MYQQACDEVAGQHKEDIHADKASRKPGNLGVRGNYQKDRNSAQTLDVTAISEAIVVSLHEYRRQLMGQKVYERL
jgi:hypothetical protein